MINEEYKAMLGGKSVIRELSEYATSRGAEIGYQNVFDYSLGNPSVPAPKSFTDAMVDLYENGDPVAIHGYSPSLVSHPSRTRSPKTSTNVSAWHTPATTSSRPRARRARCPTRCVR